MSIKKPQIASHEGGKDPEIKSCENQRALNSQCLPRSSNGHGSLRGDRIKDTQDGINGQQGSASGDIYGICGRLDLITYC